MAAVDSAAKRPGAVERLRPWISPRRRRFWLLLALFLYTLSGFFLAPWLLERVTVNRFSELGRTAVLGRVAVNPFLLTVTIENARLDDEDGRTILAYDEYFLDLQLSSLLRWAWTLKTVRIVGLEILEERFDIADTRFLRLVDDLTPPPEEAPEPPPEGASRLPRLILQNFNFQDGRLRIIDRLAGDFEGEFGPISMSMQNLQTLPDRSGNHTVSIETNNGGRIQWSGAIKTVPFESRGEVSITGSGLADAFRYADHFLPFRIEGSGVDIRFDYRLALERAGFAASVDGLEATADGVRLVADGEEEAVLSTTSIRLSEGALRWPESRATAKALTVEGLDLHAALERDGSISLERLLPAGNPSDPPRDAADGATDFMVELGRFEIPSARIHLEDRSREPAVALSLEDLRLLATGIDNQEGTAMPLEFDLRLSSGGTVAFRGQAAAFPSPRASGDLTVAEVVLALAQPYVEDFARIDLASGILGMRAELVHGPEQMLSLQGALELSDLEVRDQVRKERLVGWSRLDLERFELDLSDSRLATSELEFLRPYGRLHIAEDFSTNIAAVILPGPEAEPPKTGDATTEPEITLSGLRFEDAALDFSDFSLPLPFEAEIRELSGHVSTLASATSEPAAVDLEGRVNEYGSAVIRGEINAWSPTDLTHIDMVFRNLDMSRLTPYTVQFAGYAIEDGRLDLDLAYRIDERLLKGENSVVIREMKLGEKIDHPDAGSLPLGLAVALLTNAEGVIDLDLPVEGDLDNPEFGIGKVVWQAIGNLITKIVTAPFRLLGGLVGIDSGDFGVLEFDAGEVELSPPDREKLVKLGEAMLQRPELTIAIPGVYAPEADRSALAALALTAEIQARGEAEHAGAELSTERERRTVEALFTEMFPGTPLETIQAEHRQPAAEGESAQEAPLDEPGYVAALRDLLVSNWRITPDELENLGRARATAAADALTQSQPDASLNVLVGEVQAIEPAETGMIPLELEVTVGEASADGS